MDNESVSSVANAGGLALFASAVLAFVWKIQRSIDVIQRTLARLEGRAAAESESDDGPPPLPPPRRRVRTNPLGVRVRRPADTDQDTEPGGRG